MSPRRPAADKTRSRTQARDTSPAAEALQIAAWRRMEAWEKLRLVSELVQATQELARAGIRQRRPDADAREQALRLAALRLDRETMIRLFAWDPAREGY